MLWNSSGQTEKPLLPPPLVQFYFSKKRQMTKEWTHKVISESDTHYKNRMKQHDMITTKALFHID